VNAITNRKQTTSGKLSGKTGNKGEEKAMVYWVHH